MMRRAIVLFLLQTAASITDDMDKVFEGGLQFVALVLGMMVGLIILIKMGVLCVCG